MSRRHRSVKISRTPVQHPIGETYLTNQALYTDEPLDSAFQPVPDPTVPDARVWMNDIRL